MEAIDGTFVRRFWDFIKAGEYERSESLEGPRKYYRFSRPRQPEFPAMLELFSRGPEILGEGLGNLTRVSVGADVSSLSAILLDDEVYGFILASRRPEAGTIAVTPEGLIPLKAGAYLDLKARKEGGAGIDSGDIAKHRSDIFRLALLLAPDERMALPPSLASDLSKLLEEVEEDPLDWRSLRKSIGLPGPLDGPGLIRLMRQIYRLS